MQARETLKPYLAKRREQQVERAKEALAEVEPEVKPPETPEDLEGKIDDNKPHVMDTSEFFRVTKSKVGYRLREYGSRKTEDHFTPHCCRHWFTTHLRRNGIKREYLKELRGDARKEAVDIYDHIDRKELRRAYLAAIPTLGIE